MNGNESFQVDMCFSLVSLIWIKGLASYGLLLFNNIPVTNLKSWIQI